MRIFPFLPDGRKCWNRHEDRHIREIVRNVSCMDKPRKTLVPLPVPKGFDWVSCTHRKRGVGLEGGERRRGGGTNVLNNTGLGWVRFSNMMGVRWVKSSKDSRFCVGK